jgi:hypothetical protein
MKLKKTNLAFFIIIVFAFLVRVFVIYSQHQTINQDNGIVGLMAKHILQGKVPLFFYGQPYIGPLEPCIIALFFLVFGMSVKTMLLAMACISVAAIIAVYFLGKELKDEKMGIYAMLFASIPPAYVFWYNIAPFGGYQETFLFGTVLLLLALKIIKINSDRKKIKYYLWMGFISGIGLYTHLLLIYYISAAGLFLIINENKKFLFLKGGPLFVATFILGSLPLWIYNLTHDFYTFALPPSDDVFSSFLHFFEVAPILLCCGNPKWLFFAASSVYVGSVLFLVLYTEKETKFTGLKFIFIFLFINMLYFFSTSHMALKCAPRHIITLFSVLIFSVSYMTYFLNKKIKYLGLIPFLFILSINGIGIYKSYTIDKKESADDYNTTNQIINYLYENKLYANYCVFSLGHKLNFLTNEKAINVDHLGERYLPYETIVEGSDSVAFIEENTELEPMFEMLCDSYKRQKIGIFYIYHDFVQKKYYGQMIPQDNWSAKSNYNTKAVSFAFDRNADTNWATLDPKGKGMYFQLDLGKAYNIYKIALFNADHWKNYPYGMFLEVSADGTVWEKVSVPENPASLFICGPRLSSHLEDGRIELLFSPRSCRYVKIWQNGEEPVNSWEINEIFIWEYLGEKTIDPAESLDIYDFLVKEGIKNIYADFWLSAKISELSKDTIKTMKPVNSHYPFRKDTSRFLTIDKGAGFIIDRENVADFERNIIKQDMKAQKKEFKNYVCFYIAEEPKRKEIYYWSGYGVIKTDRLKNMPLFYSAPEGTENTGRQIVFKNGIKFLGYNVVRNGTEVKIDYFWKIKERPDGVFVFVYFMQEGKVVFQNDHPLLEQFYLSDVPATDQIFKETYTFQDIPAGDYEISLGLWNPKKGNKRIPVISPKNKSSRMIVGKINI